MSITQNTSTTWLFTKPDLCVFSHISQKYSCLNTKNVQSTIKKNPPKIARTLSQRLVLLLQVLPWVPRVLRYAASRVHYQLIRVCGQDHTFSWIKQLHILRKFREGDDPVLVDYNGKCLSTLSRPKLLNIAK